MAKRRVYYIEGNKIRFTDFDIEWNHGFSIQQKQKNVRNLHAAISNYFNVQLNQILEVSTKSLEEIGRQLSSFNLKIQTKEGKFPLECFYQSSKVFTNFWGEYQIFEALYMSPKSAKVRLAKENHKCLIKFRCFGKDFPLEPKYLFYDWLYINAVKELPDLINHIFNYKFFTDIEFNPDKSLSCQARTLVLYIWLIKNNRLDDYINNPIYFYKNVR